MEPDKSLNTRRFGDSEQFQKYFVFFINFSFFSVFFLLKMSFPAIRPGNYVRLVENRATLTRYTHKRTYDEIDTERVECLAGNWLRVLDVNTKNHLIMCAGTRDVEFLPSAIASVAEDEIHMKAMEAINVGDFVILKPDIFEGCLVSNQARSKMGVVLSESISLHPNIVYVAAFGTGEISNYEIKELTKIQCFQVPPSPPWATGDVCYLKKEMTRFDTTLFGIPQGAKGRVSLGLSNKMVCVGFENVPNKRFPVNVEDLSAEPIATREE